MFFLQFPKLYYRCELAAIEAGEKERALMYRKKSLDAAGNIRDDDDHHILNVKVPSTIITFLSR